MKKIHFGRLAVIVLCLVLAAAGVAWRFGVFGFFFPRLPTNAIMIIAPYRHSGTWVFEIRGPGWSASRSSAACRK